MVGLGDCNQSETHYINLPKRRGKSQFYLKKSLLFLIPPPKSKIIPSIIYVTVQTMLTQSQAAHILHFQFLQN